MILGRVEKHGTRIVRETHLPNFTADSTTNGNLVNWEILENIHFRVRLSRVMLKKNCFRYFPDALVVARFYSSWWRDEKKEIPYDFFDNFNPLSSATVAADPFVHAVPPFKFVHKSWLHPYLVYRLDTSFVVEISTCSPD